MLDSVREGTGLEQVRARSIERGLGVQRVFDLMVGTLCLLLATPIMVVVALAILIEDGRPIVFSQERIGRYRRPFRMCKFRSMRKDADETLHRRHIEMVANGHKVLRFKRDPRVTRVGRFIRKWSLDELPNLFNVVRGEMSLVGPRPLVPYEDRAIGPEGELRYAVRPGITGLAQVNGRLDITFAQRVETNINYVRNRTLWMDLVIMAKTVPSLLTRQG